MPQILPTTQITVNDGTHSGAYWSPANGAPFTNPTATVPVSIPGGHGLVGVEVYMDAGGNWFGSRAVNITVRVNDSNGLHIGDGGVDAVGPNQFGGINFVGLRHTGISYNRNNGVDEPLANVSALWYQLFPQGDASGMGPSTFSPGTSVQFVLYVAPVRRRGAVL